MLWLHTNCLIKKADSHSENPRSIRGALDSDCLGDFDRSRFLLVLVYNSERELLGCKQKKLLSARVHSFHIDCKQNNTLLFASTIEKGTHS